MSPNRTQCEFQVESQMIFEQFKSGTETFANAHNFFPISNR